MKVFADFWKYNDDYLKECILFYGENFDFVDNIQDADIVFSSDRLTGVNDVSKGYINFNNLKDNQILVVLYLGANHNYLTPEYYRQEVERLKEQHQRTIIVHTNLLDHSPELGLICFDVMLNRQKLFCTEYHTNLENYTWLWMGGCRNPELMYKLSKINKILLKDNKHFLAPIRITGNTDFNISFEHAKYIIGNFLKTNLSSKTYISDPQNNIYFKPNGWGDQETPKNGGNWFPIGDEYYNSSYISVVPEVLNSSNTQFGPCEKSFDPLIKGNFLLPFAGPNFINYCKTVYGFEFPNWINYSYDSIQDFSQRLNKYIESIKEIAELELKELHDLYVRDYEILLHNRNIFYTRPYDRLAPKIKQSLELLGWM